MLTPEQLDKYPDNLVELYAKAESNIIADIARRISTYDYFIPSAQHQYNKLLEMGNVHDEILKKLSAMTGYSKTVLKSLMEDAGYKAIKVDDAIYKKAGLDPLPIEQSPALMEILETGINNTNGLFENLTRTTASTGSKQFERILDRAYMQITTGAFDYNTAIRTAVKDLASNGIAAVEYPNGHINYIESAVRRAVITGVNQTALKMQDARAAEMGSDLVETSAHAGARPSHARWQGKVFSRSGNSTKYPDFKLETGYGTGPGLGGWNCRHSFYPFFEGLSEPAYTKAELDDMNAKKYEYNDEKLTEYEASQKQRTIERNIRRWKREYTGMEVAGQPTDEAASKIVRWQDVQKDFLKQTGLKRQIDREQIAGFGRSDVGNVSSKANAYYKNWVKEIGAEGSAPKTLANYYIEKYNNSKEYELLMGYNKAVKSGDVSPLVGYDIYKATAKQIDENLIGLITSNGIKIDGYKTHFIDRVIGQVSEAHRGKRKGVSVERAKEALLSGVVDSIKLNNNKPSQRFIGKDCIVTLNPNTKTLIQLNPSREE